MAEQGRAMRLPLSKYWLGILALAMVPLTQADEVAFQLPTAGQEVPMEQIKIICEHFGLETLWEKIERDPPPHPFVSDGCTRWVDEVDGVDIYPACFRHDLKYWAGYAGEKVPRLKADAEFMVEVAELLGETAMAETMFAGVRLFGGEKLEATFSWGFGRQED